MNDRWFPRIFVSSLAVMCAPCALAAILVIPGTNTGAIPDNDPGGRTVSFAVTSTQRVSRVAVTLNITHSWVGDLNATLRSPSGEAQLVLFSRVGAGRSSSDGDASNLDGNYSFVDPAPGTSVTADLWAVAASLPGTSIIPPGNYRTSTAGMPSLSDHGGCSTRIDAAFGDAIPTSQGINASGTWTLTISDLVAGDTGSLATATLFIIEAENIFKNGFDSPVAPQVFSNCIKTTHDLTGNGLADYTTLADNGGNIEWSVLENAGGGATGSTNTFTFGSATNDLYNSADIDGDGIDDPVVFTPTTGVFQIRRSSRPGAPPLQASFGPPLAGETRSPVMLGDYDGDGLDDFVVQRQRILPPYGLSYLEYFRSSDGVRVVFAAGDNSLAALLGGGGEDFDGDGMADLVQRGLNNTNYTVYRGTDGLAAASFSFGTLLDEVLLAANRAGDARADVTAVRLVGNDIVWQTRTTGTAATSTPLVFGAINIPDTDTFASAADFDGDGLLDYSYWLRNSAGTGPSQFFVKPTTAPATTWTVNQGGQTSQPLPGSRSF